MKVLDHGYVELVDWMPDIDRFSYEHTGDSAIAKAARVSYQKGTKTKRDDEKLIRYLMKNRHTSPFEMVELKFEVKAPIFVMRQWHRHRTASINEESARYSEVCGDFYLPEVERIQGQSSKNKQCSDGVPVKNPCMAQDRMRGHMDQILSVYKALLNQGVAREIARIVLPQAMYSKMVWKIDLHNFFNFCRQRMHEHAQWEIRQYANAMWELAEPIAPVAFAAFKETL